MLCPGARPPARNLQRKKKIPEYNNQTLLGVAALTAAYVLGSAILPISNQLVNDEH